MLRAIIFGVIFFTFIVFVRLILLSFQKKPQRPAAPAPATIDAQPRFNATMTVRKFEFKRFAAQTGPADPENFKEAVTVHAAPEGTDDIRIYTLTVATPRAMEQAALANPGTYSFQRNLLLVPRYDPALIERALHDHINEIVYLSGDAG